jgi:hypothetical protein
MTDEIFTDEVPTQIVPMLLVRIRDYLTDALVEDVPDENPTKAILVKIGRMQENPVKKNVSIAISSGDYENPDYIDARIDNPEFENDFPLRNVPVGEIGGGHYWWRRGTINMQCFFVRQRYPEELAMQYAYDFYGRLLQAVEGIPLTNLGKDDYGEGAVPPVIVEGASFFESGGGDKFIWRGKLKWRILTWRP